MEIYVRNSDGLVLNSYQFNGSFPAGINNKTMYSGEDYTTYDIANVPNDPNKEWLFKKYYYIDGVLTLKYVPEEYLIKKEIERLKSELSSTDYRVIKSYEAAIIGQPVEYNMDKIHYERQSIRDKINELETYLNFK
nr:MAG TPA: hypothetical protein [Caudoviricetes sp.]